MPVLSAVLALAVVPLLHRLDQTLDWEASQTVSYWPSITDRDRPGLSTPVPLAFLKFSLRF
jgi:hypothetical protein